MRTARHPLGRQSAEVVLARWQAVPPRVLLLDEPFQGVDVGARADIAKAVRAEGDVATLVATSDREEALEVADRLFVLDSRGLRPFGDGVLTGDPIDPPLSDGLHDGRPD